MRPLQRDPRHGSQRRAAASLPYAGPPATTLGRYARYLIMKAKVRLAYRGDFLVGSLGDLLVAAIGLVFLWAVFSHVPDIAGWSFAEVLFIWGMAETVTGLFFVVFQGLWVFNQRYLLRGELDRVLLRPLDPYLQVLLDHVNLEDLPVALLGMAMMGVALTDLPPPTVAQWAMLPLFLASGVAILGGVLTAVSAVGFSIHHRGTAIGLVYQASVFNRYPLDIFGHRIRWLLTWALPFGFCAFYPATWYLGRAEYIAFVFAQPLVGLVCLAAGVSLWRRGLGRYRSPGT